MHYYPHNIGDYRKDTSHLSLLEHGIYRQLLDSYYLDETPLCNDLAKLMRSHSVRSAEEQQSLQNVLTDFFELTEEGYIHKRCNEIIAQYHGKSDKARASANARWGNKHKGSKRKQSDGNADALQTQSEGNANHKPRTKNQEYKEAPKKASKLNLNELPEDWKEFCSKERPELEPKKVFESFKDYWTSVAGVKADWTATWRNWVRKESVSPTNKKVVSIGAELMKGATYARS
jgi:uncharacterized protein YdaU (DUF1376 family)